MIICHNLEVITIKPQGGAVGAISPPPLELGLMITMNYNSTMNRAMAKSSFCMNDCRRKRLLRCSLIDKPLIEMLNCIMNKVLESSYQDIIRCLCMNDCCRKRCIWCSLMDKPLIEMLRPIMNKVLESSYQDVVRCCLCVNDCCRKRWIWCSQPRKTIKPFST